MMEDAAGDEIVSLAESASMIGTDAVASRALREVQQIIEAAPAAEKEAYMQAMQRCPLLIETETLPLKCLAYNRFDVWKTAYQILQYWNFRAELFGPRAYLPMSMTGQGALSPSDVDFLSFGHYSLTPVPNRHGKLVPCAISTRMKEINAEAQFRCAFYFKSLISELLPLNTCDFHVISCYDSQSFKLAGKHVKKILQRFDNTFPHCLGLGHLALISSADGGDDRKSFWRMIAPFVMKAYGWRSSRMHTVTATSQASVLEQLLEAGYHLDNIPSEVGGTWSVAKFREWQQERLVLEREREAGVYKSILDQHQAHIHGLKQGSRLKDPPQQEEQQQPPTAREPTTTLLHSLHASTNSVGVQPLLPQRLEEYTVAANLPNPVAQGSATSDPTQTLQRLAGRIRDIQEPAPFRASRATQQQYSVEESKEIPVAGAMPPHTGGDDDQHAAAVGAESALQQQPAETREEYKKRRREQNKIISRQKRLRRKAEFLALQASHSAWVAEHERLTSESVRLKQLLRDAQEIVRQHEASRST